MAYKRVDYNGRPLNLPEITAVDVKVGKQTIKKWKFGIKGREEITHRQALVGKVELHRSRVK